MTTNLADYNSQQKANAEEGREPLHRSILSSVSHDLKTPLSCIIGSLEIHEWKKDQLDTDEKNTLITNALQQAYRLDSFITNILDMAKLENGSVKVKNVNFMMDVMLEDCLVSVGSRLGHCKVSLKAIPATFSVTTDPLLIIQAISILLDNAAKHAMPHPIINVEYEKVGDQAVIRVRDNGSGIPADKMEKIFSKYAHFSVAGQKYSGLGLGLPICRAIMTLLGGTVTAQNSIDGDGAIFTLRFPA